MNHAKMSLPPRPIFPIKQPFDFRQVGGTVAPAFHFHALFQSSFLDNGRLEAPDRLAQLGMMDDKVNGRGSAL